MQSVANSRRRGAIKAAETRRHKATGSASATSRTAESYSGMSLSPAFTPDSTPGVSEGPRVQQQRHAIAPSTTGTARSNRRMVLSMPSLTPPATEHPRQKHAIAPCTAGMSLGPTLNLGSPPAASADPHQQRQRHAIAPSTTNTAGRMVLCQVLTSASNQAVSKDRSLLQPENIPSTIRTARSNSGRVLCQILTSGSPPVASVDPCIQGHSQIAPSTTCTAGRMPLSPTHTPLQPRLLAPLQQCLIYRDRGMQLHLRKKYTSQPEHKKQNERKNIPLNMSIRNKMREKYASQPEQKKKIQRERYASNPLHKRIANKVSYSKHLRSRLSKLHNRYQISGFVAKTMCILQFS